MRGLRRISVAVAAVACGVTLGVAPGIPGAWPAYAQSAGVAGVAVGRYSSSAGGKLVVAGTQQLFVPRGINSVGLLYPDAMTYTSAAEQSYLDGACSGVSGAAAPLTAAWNAMHTSTDTELLAMAEHWQANTVRFHVSQGALAYENENHLSQYTAAVGQVIQQARAMGLVVMVDMDTEPFSCTPPHSFPAGGGSGFPKLPTTQTREAWAQLLPRLGSDPGVILEPMNEPDSATECGTPSWQDWADGCGGGDIGMVPLGRWLHNQVPGDVVLFDGDHLAGTFAGFMATAFPMPANVSAYAVHPLFYTDAKIPDDWEQRFGSLEEAASAGGQGQAVVANAWNRSHNCNKNGSPDELTDAEKLVGDPQAGITGYLQQHDMGLSLQSWDAPEAPLADLPLDTTRQDAGDPVDSLAPAGCSFTGASMAYDVYWAQAGVSVGSPAVQVSPPLTWSANVDGGGSVVDGVTVALADNGSPFGVSPAVKPEVVSAVDVRVQKAGTQTSTQVARMTLSGTGPWWDNGSYTTATVSGLSGQAVTASPGDTLIFRVHYAGISGSQDTSYLVPSPVSPLTSRR